MRPTQQANGTGENRLDFSRALIIVDLWLGDRQCAALSIDAMLLDRYTLAQVAEVTIRKLRQHGLALPFSTAAAAVAPAELDFQI